MLKRSTLARMRLAAAAAAGALLVAGCGKSVADRSRGKIPTTAEETHSPLATKDGGADARPPPDPCPACGMG